MVNAKLISNPFLLLTEPDSFNGSDGSKNSKKRNRSNGDFSATSLKKRRNGDDSVTSPKKKNNRDNSVSFSEKKQNGDNSVTFSPKEKNSGDGSFTFSSKRRNPNQSGAAVPSVVDSSFQSSNGTSASNVGVDSSIGKESESQSSYSRQENTALFRDKSYQVKKFKFGCNISLSEEGSFASLSHPSPFPLIVPDLQCLLRRLLTPFYQKTCQPNMGWCSFYYPNKVTQKVFIIVDGVSLDTFTGLQQGRKKADKLYRKMVADSSVLPCEVSKADVKSTADTVNRWLSRLSRTNSHMLEVVTPSHYEKDILEDLFNIEINDEYMDESLTKLVSNSARLYKNGLEKPKSVKEKSADKQTNGNDVGNIKWSTTTPYNPLLYWPRTKSHSTLLKPDKFDRRELVLRFEEMLHNEYPLPPKYMRDERLEVQGDRNAFNGYVATKDAYCPVSSTSPLFGLDCEFVKVTDMKVSALALITIVNEAGDIVYHSYVKPMEPIVDYLSDISGVTAKLLENEETRLTDVQQTVRKMLPPDAILVGHSLYMDLRAMKMYHPYVIDTALLFNTTGVTNRMEKLKTLAYKFLNRLIQTTAASSHCPIEDAVASLDLAKLKLQNSFTFGNCLLGGYVPSDSQEESYIKVINIFDVPNIKKKTAFYCTDSNVKRWHHFLNHNNHHELVSVETNDKVWPHVKKNLIADCDFTFIHLQAEEGYTSESLSERASALAKLDQLLSDIYEASLVKCSFSVLFTGTDVPVKCSSPKEDRSNGIFLTTIK